MHKRHLQLKAGLVGRDTTVFEEVPGLAYLERPIRFSLRDCNTRNFCIRCLTNDEIRLLYKRLGYFEQVSWKMVRGMPREAGFSIEKKGDNIYEILLDMYPHFSTFLHFRVNGTSSPFRVFDAMLNDLCYILLVDSKGSLNH